MTDPNVKRVGYKKTPTGWLPEEWECSAFTHLFTRISEPLAPEADWEYQEIGIRSHGKGVFHKEPVLGRDLGDKRVFRCQPGALAFNIVFAWEQAVALMSDAEAGMIASHRFPMYQGEASRADERFYLWFFKSPRGKHALGLASPGGAGRNKTLGQGELDYLRVPVPTLPEQQKIADILSTWDVAIDQARALVAAARSRKTGLMQRLLSGKTRLPGYAGRWLSQAISELCTIRLSGVDKKKLPDEITVRLCNYTDVYYSDALTPDMQFTTATASKGEIDQFELHAGDVLCTKDSETANDIAKCAWVRCDMPGVLCGYHLALLRPHDGTDGAFLCQALNAPATRLAFARCANGVTRFGLSADAFKQVRTPLPPLPEQRAIAAALTVADDEINALVARHNALERQKNGLMQGLLTGKIRVRN